MELAFRPANLLSFCIRVLIFSAIASPVLAQSEVPIPLFEAEPAPADIHSEELTHPLPAPKLEVPSAPQESGEAANDSDESVTTDKPNTNSEFSDFDNYWLVSSRRSVQTIHDKSRGPWQLDVQKVDLSGNANSADQTSLSSGIVPGVPVCIFSHGSFVTWESQCKQAHQAYQRIRCATGESPLQMIFFTWPSDGPYTHIPQVDVAVRGKRAEFNGFHLATLLACLPESCPVTIIGHSHGSRVALSAMQLGAGGSIQGHSFRGNIGNRRRLRVILAAGALDHHWLNPGQRYGLALNRVECLLNLVNQNDLPLALYPFHRPFARRAIARSGLTGRDTSTLGYNAAKIRQADVTNRLGSAHLWPDYYQDPQILATIAPYLVSF